MDSPGNKKMDNYLMNKVRTWLQLPRTIAEE